MGTSPAPRVCCTTHEQIDIRGVAFPRGAPGGSCCSAEPRRTPAGCQCVWRGRRGQRPLCERRHYCRHHSRLLMTAWNALHTACQERKQLFPLLFPRDGVPADGGGKKLPLCSAGLLTSNSREGRNDAFLFVLNCSCGLFLVQSSSRPVWVSF